MLVSLHLRDFALIEEAQVAFEPGLCLLTGETGAGKSILVEALGLLAGARSDAECVRAGAREAALEALFRPREADSLLPWFEESAIPWDGECTVRRTVAASGRSTAWVNGRLVTVGQLRALGALLVQIHGQHQGQSLLEEEEHRRLLDGLPEVAPAASEVLSRSRQLFSVLERLRALKRDAAERARRIDALRFQADEIGKVDPAPGEEEDLRARRNRLAHAERIVADAEGVRLLLRDGEASALSALLEAVKKARDLASLLPDWEPLGADLASASAAVAAAASQAERTAASSPFDPGALEAAESRLADFERLRRKYGPTMDDVLAHRDGVLDELRILEAEDRDPGALARQRDALFAKYMEAADGLSKLRREAAPRLSSAVEAELAQLALGKATFRIELTPRAAGAPEEATPLGLEDIRFLFGANPGEPLRPLARVASGGELSRTMLALLTALRRGGGPTTLIFDEVDAGIGGGPAERVGRRLRDLSAGRQVLCITHLPQIAAFADHHLRVTKRSASGRTAVEVSSLSPRERVEELARMLAGEEISETARRHARGLLEGASQPG